jgi:cation-transporting P-type ATPase E
VPNEIRGLTEQEALERRQRGLGNVVQFQIGRTYIQILRANLFTFINTVLFAISGVLILLGLYDDAAVTAGLVLINVILGIIQEVRAKIKLERIALLTRPRATVIRNGAEKTIDPGEIVQGDTLKVSAGDQILADGYA